MVDGLKLTFSGKELRTLFENAMRRHEDEAARWMRKHQQADGETEDTSLVPEHVCENEAERHIWRAAVLDFLRNHLDVGETYRLGVADLEYTELLPEEPG